VTIGECNRFSQGFSEDLEFLRLKAALRISSEWLNETTDAYKTIMRMLDLMTDSEQ